MSRDPTSPDTTAIVNWDEALEIVNGKHSLLCELIEIFLREGPRLLSEAQQALEAREAATLRIAAHTLKGSARYFGARAVVDAAFEVERCASGDELAAAAAPLARAASALDQLLPELRAYYTRASCGPRTPGASQ